MIGGSYMYVSWTAALLSVETAIVVTYAWQVLFSVVYLSLFIQIFECRDKHSQCNDTWQL